MNDINAIDAFFEEIKRADHSAVSGRSFRTKPDEEVSTGFFEELEAEIKRQTRREKRRSAFAAIKAKFKKW